MPDIAGVLIHVVAVTLDVLQTVRRCCWPVCHATALNVARVTMARKSGETQVALLLTIPAISVTTCHGPEAPC